MSVNKVKGKWVARVIWYDTLGKRHDTRRGNFETKTKAQAFERKERARHRRVDGRVRFNELLAMYENDMSGSIKYSTLHKRVIWIEKNVIPIIGKKYADDIPPSMITDLIRDIAIDHDYKDSTISTHFNDISAIFTYACNNMYIDFNPCSKAIRYTNPNKIQKKYMDASENFWEIEEYNKFIECVDNESDRLMFDVLFYSGMRIGEMLALRWSEVDFKHSKINVVATVSGKMITPPKTDNSKRSIDMPERIMNGLRAKYKAYRAINGFSKSYFVFGSTHHISQETVRRHVNAFIEASGVKFINLHGFRHSHASFLLEYSNLSDILIAERMGHSVDTLQKVYRHIYSRRRTQMSEYISTL